MILHQCNNTDVDFNTMCFQIIGVINNVLHAYSFNILYLLLEISHIKLFSVQEVSFQCQNTGYLQFHWAVELKINQQSESSVSFMYKIKMKVKKKRRIIFYPDGQMQGMKMCKKILVWDLILAVQFGIDQCSKNPLSLGSF